VHSRSVLVKNPAPALSSVAFGLFVAMTGQRRSILQNRPVLCYDMSRGWMPTRWSAGAIWSPMKFPRDFDR